MVATQRNPAVMLIGLGLLIYGLYTASFVPGLLVGTPVPLILAGFVVQAVAAIAAGVGAFLGSPWTPAAVIILGIAIALTAIVEGPILGLTSFDRAVAVGVAGLVVTFLIAMYVRRPRAAF
jgi:hypothetical protein